MEKTPYKGPKQAPLKARHRQSNETMQNISTGFLEPLFHRRTLRRWEKLAEIARTANPETLRTLQGSARAIGLRAATVNHIATTRLTLGSGKMGLPPSTDWACRPGPWAGPLSPSGFAPAHKSTEIGEGVTLYHDCKKLSLSVRQVRNTGAGDMAPFGLQMDVFDFDGSFLSLVVRAPESGVTGLKKKHILRLSLNIDSERALEISARLNLKNGPNTEQVSRPLDQSSGQCMTEFDLTHIPFNELRLAHMWFDLFFESPSMNQILIRDLTLSRHPRAEL